MAIHASNKLRKALADTSNGCRNYFRHIRTPQPPPTSVLRLSDGTLTSDLRAIHKAFHYAKDKCNGDDKHGPNYIEPREFRLFLRTLRQYFEYYQAFDT